MEKYNEISGGCEFDAYGNDLRGNKPVQTFPTEMFHHNDYHYNNSAPYTALNGVFYQANNQQQQQQQRNDMLNYSQPIPQQHRQQFAGVGGDIYSEQPRQQHQASFLDTDRGAAHQEAEHQQKPYLTAHYGLATDETSVQMSERPYRLMGTQNTQQLLRPSSTMAPASPRQLKHQHLELDYEQQQSQCYPNQAGYELHHGALNGFPTTGNFPVQQEMLDCYANAADPYRGLVDVSLNENLAAVVEGEGLLVDTTATNPQYEQQQPILFGQEQSHPFAANSPNDCNNFSMLPPPPPPSLNDDGDLNGGGQAQNYYSPCEFVGGEPVNQDGIQSVLESVHQDARSSDGSISTNLNSRHIVDTEKGVYVTGGGVPSDQMRQTRQYSSFQYSAADQRSLDETTSHNQTPDVKDNQMMNHRFENERAIITRNPAANQQDYIDMLSSGSLSQEWLDTICRQMIEHMDSFGICVIDNFLGSIKGELILGEVKQLFSQRSYSTGRLVSDKLDSSSGDLSLSNDPVKTIRNDRVIWVDGCEKGCEEINNLIQTLCSVITNSSRLSLYSNNGLDKVVISKRTKAHVACYPGNGTRYIKHVDNPNGDGRVITAIYYPNKSWSTKQDGGLLRMFPAGVETVANIEPLFDRVLFFWSDRRNPHEVLPAYRDRYAITVWYIGDNRSQEA